MRIHILSDLHFEKHKMDPDYVPPECDVVVLAGDISPGLPGIEWAKATFSVPVIYVMGNHEYWHQRGFYKIVDKLKAATAGSNVHLLQNEAVVIDGVRFIGATLWADFNLTGLGPYSKVVCHRALADYDAAIHLDDGTFLGTDEAMDEHFMSRDYIHTQLREQFDGKTVVVTHYGCSPKSVHPRWVSNLATPGYVSDLDYMMHECGPVLWIHGHVHDAFDYQVAETRVVTNPRGYPAEREAGNGFIRELVVTI
jgi:predicted phosphodiesterase